MKNPSLTLNAGHTSPRERPGRIRVYVDGYRATDRADFPTFPKRADYETEGAYDDAYAAADTAANASQRRRNAEIKNTVRQAVCEAFGIASAPKMTWQAKAGCKCGCSPAFILEMTGSEDLFLTIHTPESLAKEQARQAESKARESARLQAEGAACYQI